MTSQARRIIVGISGSSGPIYGVRMLEALRAHADLEVHLVMSAAARRTIELELGRDPDDVRRLAHVVHDDADVAAPIASGSFLTEGMAIAPCSIKTLSAVANSYNDNLLARAADVCLKERRRLVLMVRETPLHLGHLRLMTQATEAGAIIMPPVPAFYHRPSGIEEIVDQSVTRALDVLGIHLDLARRWQGPK